MLPKKIYFTVFLFIMMTALPVHADVITFRDGRVVEGKLTGQSRIDVVVRIDKEEFTYQKKLIRSIRYGETADEKAKFEELKKKSASLKSMNMDVDAKRRELDRLQNEIEKLFKEQEERRKIAQQLDEEFQALLKKEISGPNALLRQAVYPGWGHYYRGENVKAMSWAAVFSVALLNAYAGNQSAAKSEASYKDSVMLNTMLSTQLPLGSAAPALMHFALVENNFQSYNASTSRYNQSLNILGAVYVLSLGHLAWDNWFKSRFASGGDSSALMPGDFNIYYGKDPGFSSSSITNGDAFGFSMKFRY